MKCVECKYHSCIDNTYFCDINPKKSKRLWTWQAEIDVPCGKYDKKERRNENT